MSEDLYLAERNREIESHNAESQSYDKLLITLASGAFGLSFTFMKLVVPEPASETIWILALAWLFLISSLVGSLLSRLFSQYAHKKSWENLDEKYKAEQDSTPPPEEKNQWNIYVRNANITTPVTFILGILFLTVFAVTNLYIEAEMTDKRNPIPTSDVEIDTGSTGADILVPGQRSPSNKSPNGATEAPSAPITTNEDKQKKTKPKTDG